jgi:hypothetical protein
VHADSGQQGSFLHRPQLLTTITITQQQTTTGVVELYRGKRATGGSTPSAQNSIVRPPQLRILAWLEKERRVDHTCTPPKAESRIKTFKNNFHSHCLEGGGKFAHHSTIAFQLRTMLLTGILSFVLVF